MSRPYDIPWTLLFCSGMGGRRGCFSCEGPTSDAAAHLPLPAFWWTDAASPSAVCLATPTSGHGLRPAGTATAQTRAHAHRLPGPHLLTTLGLVCLSHFCTSVRCYVTPHCHVGGRNAGGPSVSSRAWQSSGFRPLGHLLMHVVHFAPGVPSFCSSFEEQATILHISRAKVPIGASWNSTRPE